MSTATTNFQLVAAMNTAFGNLAGIPEQGVSMTKVRKQCLNMADELGELFIALGAEPEVIKKLVHRLKAAASDTPNEVDLVKTRDSLADIHVFAYGANHIMGIDADADMREVVSKVMTRFVKDEEDKEATIKKHAELGVTDVRFEGVYPEGIIKSNSDQPDAPAGKFLKSASYQEPTFYDVDFKMLP